MYADNGVYTVTVTVTDDEGAATSDSLLVTVANVAPTLNAGPDRNTIEGGRFNLLSIQLGGGDGQPQAVIVGPLFNDGGTLDSHTATIDWGDGTAIEAGEVLEQPGGPPGSTAGLTGRVVGQHVYADNGEYTVTITLTDDDGESSTDSFVLTVANAAPTLIASEHQTVVEGDVVHLDPAEFIDLGSDDSHTASIDWGDGQTSIGIIDESPFGPPGAITGVHGTISGSHVYADNGDYLVTITLTDDDGAVSVVNTTFTVTATNAVPTVNAGPDITVNEGQLLTLPATFTDAGTSDSHTASVNWGDGSVSAGAVTETPFGPPGNPAGMAGQVVATHTFADEGTNTVTLTVLDDDGGAGTDTITVTVLNVAPTVVASADQLVAEGSLVNISATFTDPGAGDTHTAKINWGDGTIQEAGIALVEGQLTIAGSHTYVDDGVYTVSVSVLDNDGGEGFDSLFVTVDNVAPVTQAGEDFSVDEGVAFTLLSSFTDVGVGDSHIASVDFGDGTFAASTVSEQGGSGSVSTTHSYQDNGVYLVTVTVIDDDGGSSTDTLTITVNNRAPVAVDDKYTTDEDHVVGDPGGRRACQ